MYFDVLGDDVMTDITTIIAYIGTFSFFIFGLRLLTKKVFVLLNPMLPMFFISLFFILDIIMPSVDFWLEYGFSFSEDYSLILSLIVCIVPFLVLFFKVSGSINVFNTTKSTVLDAITESLRRNGIEYYEMMLEPKILLTEYEGCSIKIKHSSDSAFITFRKFNKVPFLKKDIKREFKDAINNKTFNGLPVTSITFICIGIFFFLILLKLI